MLIDHANVHESDSDAVDTESTRSENSKTYAKDANSPERRTKASRGRSISLTVRSLLFGALTLGLVAAVTVLGWLYFDTREQLNAQAVRAANDSRAEKIALDYAVNAATMNYKDLQAWHVKLVAGTTPELNKKLSDAGTSMEQVLVPLQWSSTAAPLVAKVRSSTGGVYIVDSFVSVQTKTVQAPEPLQSTATYSTTIDSNNNWQITDVGGIGSAMGPK
ncbi:hypothetical protein A5630_20865 [Mycolicibacterium mucogenicum]|uniref:Mammalian cell entry protein n=1 Tax=Mycolicibacterium mucogenicum TaxID=56689 RepID=A0A1A3H4D6_MYCMU|nr:hypothetical protein [Mycolicibacterium mucogenicum]OBJ42494.1 hypothetical protein A5630_20865 [Mycolicibacterium mucogenicum]